MADFFVLFHSGCEPEKIENICRSARVKYNKLNTSSLDPVSITGSHIEATQWPRMDRSGICCHMDVSGNFVVSSGNWNIRYNGIDSTSDSKASSNTLLECINIKGIGSPDLINGIYCIVYYDKGNNRLLARTSRSGTLHLFWRTIDSDIVALSTSQLLLASAADHGLCPESIFDFICSGIVFDDRSLFSGIEKVNPFSIYTWSLAGRHEKSAYWNPAESKHKIEDIEEASDRVISALDKELSDAARVNGKPVSDLTGGIDSRLLLLGALKEKSRFDFVTNGLSDKDRDVIIASRIAERMNLNYSVNILPGDWGPGAGREYYRRVLGLTDGLTNAFDYAKTFYFHERCRDAGDTSTLNGSGGEMLRDFWWEPVKPFPLMRKRYWEWELIKRHTGGGSADVNVFRNAYRLDFVRHFRKVFNDTVMGMSMNAAEKVEYIYLMQRMQRWQGAIASATNRVWKQSSPMLTDDFLKVAVSIHPKLKLNNALINRIFYFSNKYLSLLETDKGLPLAPLNSITLMPYMKYIYKQAIYYYNRLFPVVRYNVDRSGDKDLLAEKRQRLLRHMVMKDNAMNDILDIDYMKTFVNVGYKKIANYDKQMDNILYLYDILELLNN